MALRVDLAGLFDDRGRFGPSLLNKRLSQIQKSQIVQVIGLLDCLHWILSRNAQHDHPTHTISTI